MLKKIEVWDFECHEHSVLHDFDPGLNLIYGESDSGKTSLVRALKLVAYNNFDPLCVRTGAKNCRVRVESDKGYVEVVRGTKNEWTTCLNGEPPQVFSKIGKKILPQAADILGLHVVELGDIKLPVNVMDQGEGHFMLNELGGDSASGSMRAQIIDEISGLSGIEGLVKEVSLDRHRFGREMKLNEDQAKELRESMHDVGELDAEEILLTEVESLMRESTQAMKTIQLLADVFEEHHKVSEEVSQVDSRIKAMPNTKVLKAILGPSQEVFEEVNSMLMLHQVHARAKDDLGRKTKELSCIPDLDAASKAIAQSEVSINKAASALSQAEELSDAIEDMGETEERLQRVELSLGAAIKERNDALADVDVCPLFDRPVSPSCTQNVKFPVTEKL